MSPEFHKSNGDLTSYLLLNIPTFTWLPDYDMKYLNRRCGKGQEHKMIIYTIGYEGLDIQRFLKGLNYFDVSVLVDVREQTNSRKKDFSKMALKKKLESNGIKYIHLDKVGTPKDLRSELKKTGDYETFFEKYRCYLRRNISEINIIIDLLENNKKLALMCFEKRHDKCHRKIIAEEIKMLRGNGLEIKPIIY